MYVYTLHVRFIQSEFGNVPDTSEDEVEDTDARRERSATYNKAARLY